VLKQPPSFDGCRSCCAFAVALTVICHQGKEVDIRDEAGPVHAWKAQRSRTGRRDTTQMKEK
jgi:hypothetical protein